MKRFATLLFAAGMVIGSSSLLMAQHTPQAGTPRYKILVERFSNTNCGNCAAPDNQFDAWAEDSLNHPNVDLVQINYHNEITNDQDPFYLAAKADVDARSKDLYNIGANPRAFIDGADAYNTANSWETNCGPSFSTPMPGVMTISTSRVGDSGPITITVTVAGDPTLGEVALFVAMTESNIIYDNKKLYGNPPSGHWDNIFRGMINGSTGSAPFTQSSTPKTFTYTYNPPDQAKGRFLLANTKLIAFVQGLSPVGGTTYYTYGVQVDSLKKYAPGNIGVAANGQQTKTYLLPSAPNPFNATTNVRLSLDQASHVRLVLCDMLGRDIREIANQQMTEGQTNVELSHMDMAAGVYMVRMFVDGVERDHQRLVYQP